MTFATKHGWRRHVPARVGRPSRLPLALACALTTAFVAVLAGCAGSAAAGHGGASSAAAAGASGSAGTASGAGGAGAGAAGAGGPVSSGKAVANVLATARALLCPPAVAIGRPGSTTASKPIPAGFHAVAVVRCIPTAAIGPAQGGWANAQKEVAVTGLGPLLAALGEPSAQHVHAGPGAGCPVPAVNGIRLMLVGARGTVIYPRIPVTACGAPIQPVTASLSALHWIALGAPVNGAATLPQTVGGTAN
jgi:hypothetical protein